MVGAGERHHIVPEKLLDTLEWYRDRSFQNLGGRENVLLPNMNNEKK
jgi:hypothetical protein